jgi:hypothetical protein
MNLEEHGMAEAIARGSSAWTGSTSPRQSRSARSPHFAREWVMRSDQRNAELVATTLPRADAVVRIAMC